MKGIHASIEFRNWRLPVRLGHYDDGAPVPDWHEIDLTLTLDPGRVLVDRDTMQAIFDYDPLRDAIRALAGERHFETQEYFVSRLARIVAAHPEIAGADIVMRKAPVWDGTGSAGVRLRLDADALAALRDG